MKAATAPAAASERSGDGGYAEAMKVKDRIIKTVTAYSSCIVFRSPRFESRGNGSDEGGWGAGTRGARGSGPRGQ